MKLDHTLKRLGGQLRDRSNDVVAAELPPRLANLLKQLETAFATPGTETPQQPVTPQGTRR